MPRKAIQSSVSDLNAAAGGAAAVDRALTLLQCFRAGDGPLSLADLAERTVLYKSTVLRLLASLEHAMLIERLGRGAYVLGHGVERLHHVYSASYSLERIVMPALRDLVHTTQESAAFHVLWGSGAQAQRLSLFRVDSPQPIRDHYKAGDMLPMSGGMGAKVLIAFSQDDALISAHFKGKKGQQQLARIRLVGYAGAVGDRAPEVAGIAAPVFKAEAGEATAKVSAGGARLLAGALILTMPSNRYNTAHIAAVVESARQLSARI